MFSVIHLYETTNKQLLHKQTSFCLIKITVVFKLLWVLSSWPHRSSVPFTVRDKRRCMLEEGVGKMKLNELKRQKFVAAGEACKTIF